LRLILPLKSLGELVFSYQKAFIIKYYFIAYMQPLELSSEHFFGQVEEINISDIRPSPYNCRNSNDASVKNLAYSIKQHGLLQPIIVRTKDNSYFEIVAGCTRYLACKSINWKKIPCQVVHLNDMQTFEAALVENIQRESLSPLDEANAFKMYVLDKGWGSVSELSSKIGKSPSYITKRIGLLVLPSDVQKLIEDSTLKPSSAEELLSIKEPERQSQLGKMIVKRHLTTMKARELVREDPYYCENTENVEVRSTLQSFNKSIVILKIAMSKLATVIEKEKEDGNFIVYELLMHQKKLLHDQIDTIMRAKKKYAKNIFRYRKIMNN
jgi:ParB family transcriptional regulator, chromosome partitioning protein